VITTIIFQVIHLMASNHARPGAPLVHGALQPTSVWVNTQGRVRVSDFEIGPLAEFVMRGLKKNDPAFRFVAPERSKNWQKPSPPVDIYSTGALMLELISAGRLSEVQSRLVASDKLSVLYTKGVSKPLLQLRL
jgi:serine/threonine protein kinase